MTRSVRHVRNVKTTNLKSRIAIPLTEFAKNAPSVPPVLTRQQRALTKLTPSVPHAHSANLASTRRKLAQQIRTQFASHARIVRMENSLPVCALRLLTLNAEPAKFARLDSTFFPLVTERRTQLVRLVRHLVTVTTTKRRHVVEPKTASALPAQRATLMNMRLALAQPQMTALANLARLVTLEVSSNLVALGTETHCAKHAQNAAKTATKLSPVEPLRTQSANCAQNATMTRTKLRPAPPQPTANAKIVLTALRVRTKSPLVLGRRTLNAKLALLALLELSKLHLAPQQVTECAMCARHLAKQGLTKPRNAQLSPTENALLAQSAKMASLS